MHIAQAPGLFSSDFEAADPKLSAHSFPTDMVLFNIVVGVMSIISALEVSVLTFRFNDSFEESLFRVCLAHFKPEIFKKISENPAVICSQEVSGQIVDDF